MALRPGRLFRYFWTGSLSTIGSQPVCNGTMSPNLISTPSRAAIASISARLTDAVAASAAPSFDKLVSSKILHPTIGRTCSTPPHRAPRGRMTSSFGRS